MRAAAAALARPPRGRPKKGELRPKKLPRRSGAGRPNKAEAAARAAAKVKLEKEHRQELAERARAHALEARKQAAASKAQRTTLAKVGGDVPDDPLAAADRLFKILVYSAELALQDTTRAPYQVRAELRSIASSAQGLLPASRMLEAERIVRGAIDKMSSSGPAPTMTTPMPSAGPLQIRRRDG